MTWFQYISFTCPSSSAGTQVSAQQADRNTGLLDGSWLLEAHCCDGLQRHERRHLKKTQKEMNCKGKTSFPSGWRDGSHSLCTMWRRNTGSNSWVRIGVIIACDCSHWPPVGTFPENMSAVLALLCRTWRGSGWHIIVLQEDFTANMERGERVLWYFITTACPQKLWCCVKLK